MRRFLLLWMFSFFSVLIVFATDGIEEGVIRVKLTPAMAAKFSVLTKNQGVLRTQSSAQPLSVGVTTFDAVCHANQVTEMKRIIPYSPNYEKKHQKYGLDLWYQLVIPQTKNPEQVAQAFGLDSNVEKATVVYKKVLHESVDASTITKVVNDPQLLQQWHYENIGQTGGVAGMDINLANAWKLTMGNPNVVVAVIDGGIDVKHTDLKDNIWINEAEKNGQPGVDNDGNGFIGDVHGYNFITMSPILAPHHHGTHVAGTIAASNNNGIGVAGVAGGSGHGTGVRLMSCQVFDNITPAGSGFVEAFMYAADNGAVIAQNSWGYQIPGLHDELEHLAIKYFVAEAGRDENGNPRPNTPMVGGIVIFAAGNSNGGGAYYPGAYNEVMAVAATDDYGNKAHYSNYGSWVDITAPGGDTRTDITGGSRERGILSTDVDNTYSHKQGTSMACPHVSGVAALILSKHGSSTFTPKDLWKRITQTARPLSSNEYYNRGLLGTGMIDAARALGSDNPPSKIENLSVVTYNIQAHAGNVQWSAKEGAFSYEIACATTEITEDNFQNHIVVDKLATSGTTQTHRISGLQPVTTYHVAVKAVDLWGGRSPLSNVVSFTTKTNPVINIDTKDIIADIDASQSMTKDILFDIKNTGAANLSYSTWITRDNIYRTAKVFTDSIILDKPGAEGNKEVYFTGNSSVADETSTATRFTVTNDAGFALTHIKNFYRNYTQDLFPNEEPITIEIYRGSAKPADGRAVYSQTFLGGGVASQFVLIPLDEIIEFRKGEDFWIVVKYPIGYLVPIGVSQYLNGQTGRQLYRVSAGGIWQDLNQGIEDGSYKQDAFRIRPVSAVKGALPTTLTMATNGSGSIGANSTKQVTARFDATSVINGSYDHKIYVSHSDSMQSVYSINADMNVAGHKADITVPSIIDWGLAIKGANTVMPLTIVNNGFGALNISDISIDNNAYTVAPDYLKVVEPKGTGTVYLRFKPEDDSSQKAKLTINSDIDPVSLTLFGRGQDAPVMRLSQSQITEEMAEDEKKSTTVNIQNDGDYPLHFSVKGQNNTLEPSAENGRDITTGYTWMTSRHESGPQFRWLDISLDGEDVTKHVDTRVSNFNLHDLGFVFNYYNQKYTKITVSNGMVVLCNAEVPNSQMDTYEDKLPTNSYYAKNAILAPFWFDMNGNNLSSFTRAGGKVFIKEMPGKYIIQFNGISLPRRPDIIFPYDEIPATKGFDCQVILYSNGLIEFNYKGLDEATKGEITRYGYVGIQNHAANDGFTISEKQQFLSNNENLSILITPPDNNIVESVLPMNGVIPPGESMDLDVNLSTFNQGNKSLESSVFISSNDPTGDAKVDIIVVPSDQSGKVEPSTSMVEIKAYIGESKKSWLYIYNNTHEKVEIDRMDVINGTLSTAIAADLKDKVIPSGGRAAVEITYTPTVTGPGMAMLNFIYTDPTYIPSMVSISCLGQESPTMEVDLTPIELSLNKGEVRKSSIEIKNTGNVDGSLVMASSNWIKMGDLSGLSEHDHSGYSTGYYWEDNQKSEAVSYNWIAPDKSDRIMEDPMFSQSSEQPLNFEFDFYGNKYNTIYVGTCGAIGFEKQVNVQYWQIPAPIPSVGLSDNFIAVMRTDLGTIPYGGAKGFAVYHTKMDDMSVITWETMPSAYTVVKERATFQVILYKDGRIKMQYKDVEKAYWRNRGIIGIENSTGTEGVEIDLGTTFYTYDQMAILISPASINDSIEAGKSKTVDYAITTENLSSGVHNGIIYVQSNGLNDGLKTIPVILTVNQSEPVWRAKPIVDFEEISSYEADTAWITYTKDLYIPNKSSDRMVINGTSLLNNTEGLVINPASGNYPVTIAVDDSILFKVRYTPKSPLGEISETVSFITNDASLNEIAKVEVKANVGLPAVVAFDNPDLRITTVKDGIERREFVITNEGSGVLKYNIKTDDLRINQLSVEPGLQKDMSMLNDLSAVDFKLSELKESQKIRFDKSPMEAYVDTMRHPLLDDFQYVLGSGGLPMAISTCFRAGEKGFNLTDVVSAYFPGMSEYEGRTVDVEIRVSSIVNDYYTAENATPIYNETFNMVAPTEDLIAQKFKLSKSQYIYPNEYVYIIFKFNFCNGKDQGIPIAKLDVDDYYYIPNVCMKYHIRAFDLYGYTDLCLALQAVGEGNAFYTIALSSDYAQEDMGNWLSLENASGEIAPGDSKSVILNYDATKASTRMNQKVLVIETNDPVNLKSGKITQLNVNSAPVITLPEAREVKGEEGKPVVYEFKAEDLDGDEITLSIEGLSFTYPAAFTPRMNSYYTAMILPDMGSAGEYLFTIKATDSFGQSTYSKDVKLIVEYVNQAPTVISSTTDYLVKKGENVEIDLSEIFNDPENEALTYSYTEVKGLEPLMVKILDGILVVQALSENVDAEITLTATDPHGKSASWNIAFKSNLVGIDFNSHDADIVITPRVVKANTGISVFLKDYIGASIQLYNMNGIMLESKEIGSEHEVVTAPSVSGLYILKVVTVKGQTGFRIMVE